MITVYLLQDVEKGKTMIEVEGHADKQACAAVSAIIQTAALGLEAVSKIKPNQVKFIVKE